MNREDDKCKAVTHLQDQRRIERPATGRATTVHEQGRQHDGEGKRHDPERPVVQSWQGHVWRTDHHRYHPVGKTHEGRHDHTEDHDDRVHGGHGVEKHRVNDLDTWLEQLGTNDQCHTAADEKHQQGEPQVKRTDIFMVGSRYPTHETRRRTVMIVIVTVVFVCAMMCDI